MTSPGSAPDAEATAEVTAEQVAIPATAAPPVSPTSPMDIRSIKLQPNVRAKAANLLLKITANPQVMSRNAAGELVLYGEPVVGSDFDAIFQAVFTGNSATDLPGTDSVFRGLRTLRVSKNALSSRNFVKAYGSTPRRTGPLQHGMLALDEEEDDESPSPKLERADEFKTSSRGDPPRSPPVRPSKSMKQSGRGFKTAPPGWRPNVRYVY